MSVFVTYLMQIICIFLTFLSTFFPSINHSCQYCDGCQHEGGTATCISRAVCDVCGEEYGYLLDHKMTKTKAKAPTCEENGNKAYWYCSMCETYYADAAGEHKTSVDQMILAKNPDAHNWDNGSITTVPSCQTMGIKTYVCTLNQAHTKTEQIGYDANNHVNTENRDAVAATCTQVGYAAGVFCLDCNAFISGHNEIAANGHAYTSSVTTEATCTEAGVKTFTCAACGDTYTDAVPATGHTEVIDAAVAATCTATGLTEGKHCDVCGEVLVAQEVVDALGHTEVIDAAVAATCTATGLTEGSHCDVCGEVLVAQEVVDALGHTEVIDAAVAATCTETGLTEGKHCDVCGEVLVAQEVIDALGHTEVIDAAVAATCTETGFTEGKHCDVCGEVLVAQEVVDALGHTEVIDAAVAATCTETGLTEGKHCDVCGEVLIAQTVVDALGHDYGEWIAEIPATCVETGILGHYTCSVCSVSFDADKNEIADLIIAVDTEAHAWNAGAVTTDPGCKQMGIKTYTCGHNAEHTKTEEIGYNANNHINTENRDAVAATCTTDGYTAGVYCKDCETYISGHAVIPAIVHGNKEYHAKVDATCVATGTIEYWFCPDCGKNFSDEACSAEAADLTIAVDPDNHDLITTDAKAPACEAIGWNEYVTCQRDGCTYSTYEEKAAIGHNYVGAVTTEPTCKANGVKTFTCQNDPSHTYTEVVPALGHADEDNNGYCDREECKELICDHVGQTTVLKSYVDATCTEDGYSGDKHCAKCDIIVEQGAKIEKRGHDYEGVVTTEPTCTAKGVKTYTCKNDANHTYTEDVAALGHAEVSHEAQAPTCTEIGWDAYVTCSRCDYTTYVEKEKLGHSFTNYVPDSNATCTEDGTKTAKCDRCDETDTVTDIGSATGHNYDTVVTAPTCTEDGYTTYTCSACGDSYVADEVAALGHTESAAVEENRVESTCTVAGSYDSVVYCSVCKAEISRKNVTLELAAHTEGAVVVENKKAATCTAEGSYDNVVYCTECNAELSRNTVTVEKIAHAYESVVTAPTCTEKGYTTYTCSACGDSYVADEVDALGHTEVIDEAVAATCTETGLTEGKHCDVCGEVLAAQEVVDALGHTETVDAAVAATCTATGLTEGKHCDVCGEVLVAQSVVDALGHTEVIDEAVAATCTETGLTEGKHCSVCGEVLVAQEVVADLGHTNKAAVEENRVESTCTVAGSYESVVYCSVCNAELSRETVVLELAAHTEGAVVVENEKAATCTAEGSYDNVVYCTVCNAALSRNTVTVEKIAHAYESVVTAPTCTEDGYTTYTCSACGDSYVADEVAALGHTESAAVEENRVESTCTVAGSYESVVYCSVCKAEISRDTVALELAAHTEGAVVVENEVAATCTAEGSYDNVVYCTVCNAELSRNTVTVEKIAHTPAEAVEENRTESTCTVAGSYESVVYCSVCNTELSRDTVALELAAHTAGKVVVENEVAATCTGEGSYDNVVYCTVCNAELSRDTVTVEKIAHAYESVVTAPTCTDDGYTTYTCSTCGDSYVEDEVAALGHTEVIDAAVAPTCTATGLTEGKHCSVCNTVLVAQTVVAAKGHTNGSPVEENRTDPTCTADGSYDTVIYCTVCSAQVSRVTTMIPATGHNFENYTKTAEATCVSNAKQTGTCSACGTTDVIDIENTMLSHTPTDANGDGVCDTCNETIAFRFDPLEYPEEAIVEKTTASELRTYLSRADKNDNLYVSTQGYDDNGIIASPYFDVKIEGQSIPVYGTVVYVADSASAGHGALHSFSEIYVNASESVKEFNIELTSIWNELNITDAKILSAPGYTNSTLEVSNGKVTATLSAAVNGTTASVYTFVFNGHDSDYVFTLAVRPYYDDDATIALMESLGYTVYVLDGYVDNVYDYVCFSGGEHTDNKGIQVNGDKQVIYLKQGTYVTAKHFADINSDADNTGNAETGAAGNNGIGLNRYPFISSNGKNAVYIYGFGTIDLTHLDRGERRGFVFSYASDIQMIGTKLINPCEWAIVTYRCDTVLLSNVDVYGYRQNSDAFDICNSKNVTLQDCIARTGDDCFCVKTLGGDENAITDNVTVQNCYAWASKARAFGIFGEINRPITNVNFINSTVLCHEAKWDYVSIPAIGIVATENANKAGAVSNVTFDNIEICRNDASAVNCIIADNVGTAESNFVIQEITFNNIRFPSNNSGYPIIFNRYGGNNDMYSMHFTDVYCGNTLITRDNALTYVQDETSRWHIFDKNAAG